MRNSSSLDWLRFMHTPNDYRVSQFENIRLSLNTCFILYLEEKSIVPAECSRQFPHYGMVQ